MYSEKFVERFWSKVDKTGGPDACWLWTGALNNYGYGETGVPKMEGGYKTTKAHRVSLELAMGRPIGTDLCALHHCLRTRQCVNPAHLYEGTRQQNMDDMKRDGTRKGIAVHAGENHPMSKLTLEQVEEIRVRVCSGRTHKEVAAEFGISRQQVGRIVNRARWPPN